jgi:crotonobetainyl-CoA:carnitine CoA-transferase CaiB-like acyl-CoA transferase
VSAIFHTLNRGKRSIALDLKKSADHAALLSLVATADVFVQNLRPGVATRLGLDEGTLREARADLVYVSISGFGEHGPYAERRAYDIVIQGVSGMAASQADPASGRPELIRNVVCDKITAVYAAQAITAALFDRARGGGGRHVRLAMLDVAVAFLWPDIMQEHTYTGEGVEGGPSLLGIVRIHPTHDGWITMLALTDADFAGVCRAIERADIATDPRFREARARLTHAGELAPILDDATRDHTTEDLCARLEKEGVACGGVVPPERVHADPQVIANELIGECQDPRFGTVRMPGAVARFGAARSRPASLAPTLGEHTAEILAELGLAD